MTIPWFGRLRAPRDRAGRRRQGRGRQGGGHHNQEAAGRQDPAVARERRRRRTSIGLGVALVTVIAAVAVFGYYWEFFRPPRVWAGRVNDVEFTMGDLVSRIRVLQGANRYEGGRVDLSKVPFEYLQDLIHAEILRQAAPQLGIAPTDENIELALRGQFEPRPPPGQEVDPGQLDQEFRNNYQTFLTTTLLSDADYRIIVEERLTILGLAGLRTQTIEDTMEQVEVQWIRLPLERQPRGGSAVQPGDVIQRLELESFGIVASEVSQSAGYSDTFGYVGWVPRGAFPDFDGILFGDPEKDIEAVSPGGTSASIFSEDAIYIVQVLSGPKQRELSDLVRAKLTQERVVLWQEEQLQAGTLAPDPWVKMHFNSDLYAWVADQVAITAPRLDPTEQ